MSEQPANTNGRQLAMAPPVSPAPIPTVCGVARVPNSPDGPMVCLQTWTLTGHHVVFLTLDVARQLVDMLNANIAGLVLPPSNGLSG